MDTPMTFARSILLAAAGASLLALAACGEENTSSAPAENPAAEAPAEKRTSTQDALREIQEAVDATGRAVREEAGKLGERGRQALEDAQPEIDRAGDIASKIGQSLGELADQAIRKFESGVADMERRIDESRKIKSFTGDPKAVLSPADQLRADSRAAARAQTAGVGPAYVGVWAGDAASCKRIDREPVEMFAVITTTTVRRYEARCNFPAKDMVGSNVVLEASCMAEGNTEERPIAIDMPSPDTLRIGTPDAPGKIDLVRCHLPE